MQKSHAELKNYIQLLRLSRRGVLWLNSEGRIIHANKKVLGELKYDGEEIKDKTIFEINPNMNLRRWKQFWAKLTEKKSLKEDSEYITSDDIIFKVDLQSTLIEAQGLLYCCVISQNIAEKNRFRNLLRLTSEVARIASWEWDILKEKLILSDELYSLLDLDAKKPIKTVAQLEVLLEESVPAEHYELFSQKIEKSLKQGKSVEFEMPFKTASGETRNINLNAIPVFTEGRTTRLYGIIQDISSIAARSDDLYLAKFSLENANDMIFWVRRDASIKFVNDAACRNLEYSREELLQMHVYDLAPEFPKDVWGTTHFERIKANGSVEIETLHRKKSGKTYPVFASLNYLKYGGEEYICAIIRNITAQKQQQKNLESFKFALDNATEAIFWVDKKGKFQYVNKSTSKKLGYTREELLNLSIFEVNPDIPVSEWQIQWKKLSEGKELKFETTYLRKDGSTFPALVYTNHMVLDDKELNVTFMRNITNIKARQKKLEHSLEENEKLRNKLEKEKNYLKEEININFNFDNIISVSNKYKIVLKQVEQVADTDATVLLLGETGTGKELLARAIHNLSVRSEQSLVKVNCSALPSDLIESELFGHEKGAFTGAFQRKVGRFELADGGTIFLDEIGEMPLDLQPKLLRVLQEGEFQRLGGTETLKVNVRVIAATNRNLEQLVEEGKFRQDLYYRLNVFPIYNIPLRERIEDIPLLVKHFLKIYSEKVGKPIKKISKGSLEKLMRYSFPGNIRELENIIERAVILSGGSKLDLETVMPSKNSSIVRQARFKTFEEMQRDHILEALRKANWKITGRLSAAELLGINGKTLASKMRKMNIRREDYVDI